MKVKVKVKKMLVRNLVPRLVQGLADIASCAASLLSWTAINFEIATAGRSSHHGRRSGHAGPSTVHRQ